MRALLSVYDKTGLVDLASGLAGLGWELVASGKTAAALADAGIAHEEVSAVTGSPEMLGGRVKTLHPRIHGGILADRSEPAHLSDVAAEGIELIDLVVSNLYPFASDPSVELIDVGGPAMVRAAAKNFAHVGVVTSPADYPAVLEELAGNGSLSDSTRRRLARAAFAHTAAYDAAIVSWFDEEVNAAPEAAGVDAAADAGEASGAGEAAGALLPPTLHVTLERAATLRYGENPHQSGARYRLAGEASWWDTTVQHSGTELSYLNIFDADAAWRLVHELVSDAGVRGAGVGGAGAEQAVAIIKHANPCGAAVAADLTTAYEWALAGDPLSAFGGVVALSGPVTVAVAEVMAGGPQADVVVAPSFEPEALARLVAKRKATRILSAGAPDPLGLHVRSLGGSYLVQTPDRFVSEVPTWRVVSATEPTEDQWRDLVLAWRICARTTSNAISIVHGGQAVGVGAGQQSRVVAAEIAVTKAGERAVGAAAASDAFFPFPDGLEVLAQAGVAAVVQPGGSVRDAEVTAAADAAGIAMVITGERHFRH
ncbi:MAG: bifunctional phosphoribosylaminoimidazolecarboxamide formyltransferase/IMP cyclohydrolase [Actinomycetota bacterium]|nr:bifunctional phosphoribosylaminoimidazolecarboxamide formyltransferase/IMP cyclohydrolase [Actinomycetota bacterium]